MRFDILALLSAVVLTISAAHADDVTGLATVPDGAMPPTDAVFSATLSDTSLADAPSVTLSETATSPAGAPPYAFKLPFENAEIVSGRSYTVRATLRAPDGSLLFTTDTVHPVITNGVMSLDVAMIAVRKMPDDAPGPISAIGLRLPATFSGTFPCADCEGIDHNLNLWPEGGFHLSRAWRGRGDGISQYDLGTWYADPARRALVLDLGDYPPLEFEVKDVNRLRLLARDGTPITSELNYDVVATGPLRDLDMKDIFVGGMMSYRDDVPFFTECHSGRTYPIAGGGDFTTLNAAYQRATAGPDVPLFVQAEASVGMYPDHADRLGRSIQMNRFVRARPAITCDRQRSTASLYNTYWKIETLRGAPVEAPVRRREAHVVLTESERPTYRATVGCNRIMGAVSRTNDSLMFGQSASTKMACPPPLDTLERTLLSVLDETRSYRSSGETLILKNEDNEILSVLSAVYLP